MINPAIPASVPTTLSGATNLGGLAAVGKVVFAMVVILAVIFLCAWVLRRLNTGRGSARGHLRVVGGRNVGSKEKVVIVEVEDTWLVLGVTNGGISKLHELPARETKPAEFQAEAGDSFGKRFAAALKQNLGRSRP